MNNTGTTSSTMTLNITTTLNMPITMTVLLPPGPLAGLVGRGGRRADERLPEQQRDRRPPSQTGKKSVPLVPNALLLPCVTFLFW